MAIPPQLSAWLDDNYPSPRVDPEWLVACYAWVTAEHHLDPAEHMPAIIEHVEAQLLQSESIWSHDGFGWQFRTRNERGSLSRETTATACAGQVNDYICFETFSVLCIQCRDE
ncbi:hypothetical protein FB451DRAFT_263459 [Mycena latifolia]|nr:hypothetical protein FB451DRAFT_263459 [Mycena latifolia]